MDRIRVVPGLVFLMSLNRAFYGCLLPVEWLVCKEKLDWGAVLGTLVAMGCLA